MFTEDDLIEALRHSAQRADELADHRPAGSRPRRWARIALPAASVASVLALATGAALLSDGAGSSAPTTSRPTSTASTKPQRVVVNVHVPVDISGVLDVVQIDGSVPANWMLGGNGDAATGSSNVEHPIPGTGTLAGLDVVGPNATFDPTRISRDHPLEIAGTTGYYSSFKLFPLDGSTGPYSDKYLPVWVIAFQTPHHEWAFAHIEKVATDAAPDDVSVADPAAIVAAYNHLGVTFVSGESRVPLRTGYLPAGMQLASTSFATGGADSGLVDASFVDGTKRIDIQLAPVGSQADPSGAGCGIPAGTCHDAKAVIGGYMVEVGAEGYDATTVEKVLHTLQVAVPTDQSSYWTLAAAFG